MDGVLIRRLLETGDNFRQIKQSIVFAPHNDSQPTAEKFEENGDGAIQPI
jgi:hypothetical protein